MKRLFGCTLVAALFANAPLHAEPSRILGTDDARDCALANDGTVVGATAGGLVVFGAKRGAKVLTALEGLPDTRVESVRIEGGYAEIQTKSGAARVRLGDLQVESIGGELTPRPPSMPSDPFRARAEQRSAEGRCLATDHGVFFATGTKGLERVPLAGLPTSDISAVARDSERLFVGTFDRGLFVVKGSAIERVEFGVNPNVNALAWHDGALWVGTARGVSRCEARPGAALACRRVGQSVAVHALVVSRDGSVIAGGDQGLTLFDRTGGTEREIGAKQRAPFRAVWALAESEEGTLYVGTTSGLYWTKTRELATLRFERASLVSGELPDDWVTALDAAHGSVLVGTYNAGLASFRERGQKLETGDFDTTLGYVNPAGIARLRDGRIAVATMDGLRVGTPGNFVTVPTLGRDVTGLLATANAGEYWVATRRGVERKRLDAP